MPQYPHFERGDRLKNLSASDLNYLVDRVREALQRTPGDLDNFVSDKSARPVVVIERPVLNESFSLRVQRVRYRAGLPKPCLDAACNYEAFGVPFDAYPMYGLSLADYEDFVVDDPLNLDNDEPVLWAHYVDTYWIVEKPATASTQKQTLAFAQILRVHDNEFIDVRPLTLDQFGIWVTDFALGGAGGEMRVKVPPGYVGPWFLDFARVGWFTLLVLVSGTWTVLWIVPVKTLQSTGIIPRGSCDPA